MDRILWSKEKEKLGSFSRQFTQTWLRIRGKRAQERRSELRGGNVIWVIYDLAPAVSALETWLYYGNGQRVKYPFGV